MDKHLYRIILSIVSFVFLLGITAGALLAYRLGSDSALDTYLQSYADLLRQGEAVGTPIWRAFVDAFLFPSLVFLSGLTLLGTALIPLLLLVKGFLLSFSVTAFVSVFGLNGLWMALGELGLQCILGVPCLIVLSVYGAHMALRLLAMVRGKTVSGAMFSRPLLIRVGICAILLAACALADTYLTPLLLDWIITQV